MFPSTFPSDNFINDVFKFLEAITCWGELVSPYKSVLAVGIESCLPILNYAIYAFEVDGVDENCFCA